MNRIKNNGDDVWRYRTAKDDFDLMMYQNSKNNKNSIIRYEMKKVDEHINKLKSILKELDEFDKKYEIIYDVRG